MHPGVHHCWYLLYPSDRYHYEHRLLHHFHCYFDDWSDTRKQQHQGLVLQRFCFQQILLRGCLPLDCHKRVPRAISNHCYCDCCKSTYIDVWWALTQLFLGQGGQRVGYHPTICEYMPCYSDNSREACALNGVHFISRHKYLPDFVAKWKAVKQLQHSTAVAVHCDSYRSHYSSCDSCASSVDLELTEVNLCLKGWQRHFSDQVHFSIYFHLSEF